MSVTGAIIGPDEPDPFGSKEPEIRTAEQPRKIEPINGSGGIPTLDPFDIRDAGNDTGSSATTGTERKRRGRPPGSRNKSATGAQTTPVLQDLKINIEDLLLSVHTMAAAFFHAEELELDTDEAKQGAQHIKELSKLYNHTIDPKTIVWAGFIFWIVTVYGTRGVAIYKRVNAEPKKGPVLVPKPQPQPETVKRDGPFTPSELWNEPPIDG